MGEPERLEQRPVDGEDAARGDDEGEAHLALQLQGIPAEIFGCLHGFPLSTSCRPLHWTCPSIGHTIDLYTI